MEIYSRMCFSLVFPEDCLTLCLLIPRQFYVTFCDIISSPNYGQLLRLPLPLVSGGRIPRQLSIVRKFWEFLDGATTALVSPAGWLAGAALTWPYKGVVWGRRSICPAPSH